MTFNTNQYVPLLKWRMGEYQGLMRLEDTVKDKIVPLIVITPIEYDFEDQCDKKTVDEHLGTFAKRYKAKCGNRPALIDFHHSLELAVRDSGELAVASVFSELRENEATAIPVFNVNRSKPYLDCVKAIHGSDQRGAGLRVTMSDLTDPTLPSKFSNALDTTGLQPGMIDLVIDLEAPKNFEPYANFAKIVASLFPQLGDLTEYRSFAVVATAYPESLAITKPGGSFVRHEWQLYQTLVGELSDTGRIPTYGDYGMERPEFLSLDMRVIKPGGKVVYTTPAEWLIRKGGAFRDNPGQMRQHCRDILASSYFRGAAFSAGDKFIKDCAGGAGSTSTLTMWKSVGMNHHMTQVVEDLANYHGA